MSKYSFLEYLVWLIKAIHNLLVDLDKLTTSEINVYRGMVEMFGFFLVGALLLRVHSLFILLILFGVLRFSYFLWRAEKLDNWEKL